MARNIPTAEPSGRRYTQQMRLYDAPSDNPSGPSTPSAVARLVAEHTRLTPAGPWLQVLNLVGFEVNRYELPIPGLPKSLDGLKILHLSDLHIRSKWRPWFDHLLETVRSRKPDLILITGDFVDSKRDHRPALPVVRKLLQGMDAPMGGWGIVGNHDGPLLEGRMADHRIRFIVGTHARLDGSGQPIELVGLPGTVREDYPDGWERRIPPKPPGVLRIVLSHYPDHLPKVDAVAPDLFLAGHTHGGQVCLPGGTPILRHDTLPRLLCSGVHRVGRTWLVVNRGFGYTGLPVRVFCPNEVIELVLRAV